MPQIQTYDSSRNPRTEATQLESTLAKYSKHYGDQYAEEKENDALKDIYGKYTSEKASLSETVAALESKKGVSPTTKVRAIGNLLELGKQKEANHKAQVQAAKDQKAADAKIGQVRAIEKARGMEVGSLAAYEDNPNLANSISKPKTTRAGDQPISPEQLDKIQKVRKMEGFDSFTPSQVYRALTDNGVSKENAEAESKLRAEETKNDLGVERNKEINKKQADADFSFVKYQDENEQQIFKHQETLEAARKLNREHVTGGLWDQAMQKAGLLNFTSEGFREYASYSKESVKNSNIKSIIGSQISAMEFGFFRDATISERFSEAANEKILNKEMLELEYQQLYADITKRFVKDNKGEIPERIQAKVNEQFREEAKAISEKWKEQAEDFKAIQNVPKGMVLMFTKKRKPLHVPPEKVAEVLDTGATLK
jgi:hypothetical protein